jgi:hypothetical protein
MASSPEAQHRRSWSPEEIGREERAARLRAVRDREKSREERLEETLRLSRFMSELSQGARDDLRAG